MNPNQTSTTPETNALLNKLGNQRKLPNDANASGWSSLDTYAFIDSARSLERRLNAALAEVERLKKIQSVTLERYLTNAQKAIVSERDKLQQDLIEANAIRDSALATEKLIADKATKLQQENAALRDVVRIAELYGSNSPEFDEAMKSIQPPKE